MRAGALWAFIVIPDQTLCWVPCMYYLNCVATLWGGNSYPHLKLRGLRLMERHKDIICACFFRTHQIWGSICLLKTKGWDNTRMFGCLSSGSAVLSPGEASVWFPWQSPVVAGGSVKVHEEAAPEKRISERWDLFSKGPTTGDVITASHLDQGLEF